MKKLNVLIAQESLTYRKILQEAVAANDFAQVGFTASTGQITLERLKQSPIDVVLLSMHIPEEGKLATLFTIKKEYPNIHVIMVGDADKVNTAATIRALQMGALDVILIQPETSLINNVTKNKGKLQGLFTQIMTNNYTAASTPLPRKAAGSNSVHNAPPLRQEIKKTVMMEADLIVIAASTGGPAALKYILQNISGKINIPILIVQHMPAEFTGKLAQSLNKKSPLIVRESVDGSLIEPGQAILAPGGVHLTIAKNKCKYYAKLEDSPPVNGVKPSADVLFNSLAHIYPGKKVLAVILTGMGSDGLAGVRKLKEACDCFCLVQSEQTCVVYGMPGSIVRAGLADEIQDLHLLPEFINKIALGRCSKW